MSGEACDTSAIEGEMLDRARAQSTDPMQIVSGTRSPLPPRLFFSGPSNPSA